MRDHRRPPPRRLPASPGTDGSSPAGRDRICAVRPAGGSPIRSVRAGLGRHAAPLVATLARAGAAREAGAVGPGGLGPRASLGARTGPAARARPSSIATVVCRAGTPWWRPVRHRSRPATRPWAAGGQQGIERGRVVARLLRRPITGSTPSAWRTGARTSCPAASTAPRRPEPLRDGMGQDNGQPRLRRTAAARRAGSSRRPRSPP